MGRPRLAAAALAVVGGALLIGGCRSAAERFEEGDERAALTDRAVTVGSFDFAESVVLAEIYSQALERHGIEVERAFSLGPREFVAPAIAVGLIELIPEYAGSAATFLSRGQHVPPNDPDEAHDQLVAGLEPHPVQALAAAPGENANAFVVTAATAERFDLETLSDVVPIADQLTFGGPPECNRRTLCLVGLREVYGIEFDEDRIVALDVGGPLTRQALLDGGIDIGLMFSSDSVMDGDDFVELIDDRGLQPAENVTPIVREEVLERFGPELVEASDAVSAQLTTDELRRLNALVDRQAPAEAATAWLAEQGLA